MTDTANPSGAVQVTDVDSAALEIERRMSLLETPEGEHEDKEEPLKAETDDKESTQSDEQEAEPEDQQEASFQNVDELAEALGLTVDEFLGKIKAKAKVDGQESELSLAELRDGYQREADYRKKTMELAENRRKFEAETDQYRSQFNAKLSEATTLVGSLEQQFLAEYQSINWQELRETDPAEWSAKAHEYQSRLNGIEQIKQYAGQEAQRLNQEMTQRQAQALNSFREKQNEILLSKVPEWSDEKSRVAEEAAITQFLKDQYGFTSKEAAFFMDHRMTLLARDAFKGRQTDKRDIAQKKVANIPKVLKPGQRLGKDDMKTNAIKQKQSQFKKSGSVDDLAKYLEARLK